MRNIFKFLLSVGSAFVVTLAGCIATAMLLMTPLQDVFTVVVASVASLAVLYPAATFYRERFEELFDATFPNNEDK
jgi:hypothetical protein